MKNDLSEFESGLHGMLAAYRKSTTKSSDAESEIAGIMAVFSNNYKQMITGQWSDDFPTLTYLRRLENRGDAYQWLNGFLWGIEAAGVITSALRDELLDELLKTKSAAGEADIEANVESMEDLGIDAGAQVADCAPENVSCEDCPHDCKAVMESEGDEDEEAL